MFNTSKAMAKLAVLLGVALFITPPAWPQSKPLPDAPTPQNQQQTVPDAPSASRPSPQLPLPPPSPSNTGSSSTRDTGDDNPQPDSAQPDAAQPPSAAPPATIADAPPGKPGDAPGSTRDQLFTLVTSVNFVMVPVTVKNPEGHLVEGLLANDFQVFEDGTRQPLRFFTSDPFPLSAALVLDQGMSETDFRKVKDTLPALLGAFGQFDEVSLFTYGASVRKLQDFTATNNTRLAENMRRLQEESGRNPGAPVLSGPMASGPSVNGRPFDPGLQPSQPNQQLYRREPRVMNDAILEAALDLAKRDKTRRKILFVVSDGNEYHSSASYADVLKVLLSREIIVYGVALGSAAIPVYNKLEKVHLPGMGYGDLLAKYASATGGQLFSEFDRRSIEAAYSRVTAEARNQYTLGYTTRATPSSTKRSIEVVVMRPDMRVYARDGYYPLPPGR